MKRILTLTVVAMIVLTLSACKLFNYDSNETVLEYALIATEKSDLAVLDQYPNLEYVDLRGSTYYEDILDYADTHPNVKVRFSIDLGQLYFNHDVTEIQLRGSEVVFEELLQNLKFFHSLKAVHIDQISITKAQFDELKAAYPKINFTCTVKIGNKYYDASLTELNLSEITSKDVEHALIALEFLPNLSSVELMSPSGTSQLTFSDVEKLIQAYPNLSFNYQFKLFGQNLSTKTESLTFKDMPIGNGGLNQIRDALTVMPNCTYVCLDDCNTDNDAMAKLRAEFPDVSIVWRVYVDKFSVLTDTEVILMQYSVNTAEAQPLQYCTNVKYLDMTGCKIRNFDFLANMPKLECAVLQQTYFSDSSVLQNAQNLTWLNLANCSALRDISSFSALTNLKYLNLSATKVKDISPLDQLPLERFKCVKTSIREDDFRDFKAKHPDCLASDMGSAIGKGWRYDDGAQKVPFAYYQQMIKIFGYEK